MVHDLHAKIGELTVERDFYRAGSAADRSAAGDTWYTLAPYDPPGRLGARLMVRTVLTCTRKIVYPCFRAIANAANRPRGLMIIAVLNQKGGVGKTTLAVHLCAAFAADGACVLLIDADPQGSALDWAASRAAAPLFGVVGLPKANLHKEVPSHAVNYDHVVIDGPPRSNELTRSAIMAADRVVIPVQPSPYDVWAAAETVGMIREAQAFKSDLDAVFTVNRKIVNTVIGRDVCTALADYEIPTLEAAICQRVVFAESAAGGRTVLEVAPHSLAASEIRQLAIEILGVGKGGIV